MNKKAKPIVKIIGIVLAVLAIIFIAFNIVEKIMFASFYIKSEKEFKIPGLSIGYVPQGLDYIEEDGKYLSCGYMSNGKSSRVYVINRDGSSHYVSLLDENGNQYSGHTGGIAHNGDYIYITGDDGLDVFSYKDITEGIKQTTQKIGSVKTFNNPAYCYIYNGLIYVGSFYRQGNYETPSNERITTPSGDKNTSIINVFELDKKSLYGISVDPVCVYSARGLIQGMCFIDENTIALSTSYGVAASHLYFYDVAKASRGSILINGGEKSLYFLDSANLTDTIKAPPMSEEIIYKDDKIYIMTESASNKYIFGKLTGAGRLHSVKIK